MNQHTQLAPYETWSKSMADALCKSLELNSGDITFTDDFVLDIKETVPDAKLLDIAVRLGGRDAQLRFHSAIIRYNIGRMILELSARTGQTEDYVIIELGLANRTGLSVKTLINYAGTASRLPPNLLRPGICWTAMKIMGDIRLPEDPKLLTELRSEQERVLNLAASSPEECNTAFVKREMNGVLEKLGMVKKKEPSGQQILLAYAMLLRKLRYIEETGSSFEALGFKDRAALVDQIEACENSLVNMGLIPEEVEK
jgi:hypothetical protein